MQGLGAPDAWPGPDGEPLWQGMRQNGSAHGGGTWWRPAVVYNPDDELYHGFFAYLLQNRAAEGSFHVTHYTSANLTHWTFRAFIPHFGDFSRYDSVVFRIKDGRFILVSAGNGPPNLQSHDLHSWTLVNSSDRTMLCGFGDPVLGAKKACTDEGPHATRWNGKMWLCVRRFPPCCLFAAAAYKCSTIPLLVLILCTCRVPPRLQQHGAALRRHERHARRVPA